MFPYEPNASMYPIQTTDLIPTTIHMMEDSKPASEEGFEFIRPCNRSKTLGYQ